MKKKFPPPRGGRARVGVIYGIFSRLLSFYGDEKRETSLCGEYREIFKHIERRIEEEKGDVEDWWMGLLERKEKN